MIHPHRACRAWLAAFACWAGLCASASAGDGAAAESQYRTARRLAAERSAEAAAALRKVVELDPQGPLADDALVEQASLLRIPAWPEDLGQIDDLSVLAASKLLDEVERLPGADRLAQARYHRALLRLERGAGHDPARAQLDLLAVATSRQTSPWSFAARYALAWLYEQKGEADKSLSAYQRILVDEPHGDAAARAQVGVARLLLRQGSAGAAARALQQAVDASAPPITRAQPLRELAVRLLLQSAAAQPSAAGKIVLSTPTPLRAPAALVPTAAGGALISDRKERRVIEIDDRGLLAREWQLPFVPEVIATDSRGGVYAAAAGSLHRLRPDGTSKVMAELGDYGPITSLAVDGLGGCWLLERRGRIGYLAPGAGLPATFWDDRAFKLQALVWDGRRLLALDARSKAVMFFDRSGTLHPLSGPVGDRPVAFAADPAGRLAVLDDRTGGVSMLQSDGSRLGVYLPATDGIQRPVSIGLGWDGSLHLLDAASGAWLRRS